MGALNVENLRDMNAFDLLLELAREGLEARRARPAAAPAPAKVIELPSKAKPRSIAEFEGKTHTCPRCGHTGQILTDFGPRVIQLKSGSELRHQSWCRKCRAVPHRR